MPYSFIFLSMYASASCRYRVAERGLRNKPRLERTTFNASTASAHTLGDASCAHTRTYIEESPPVWVFKIKTNADESSFCEARQCSAAGVVLLHQREIQYGLL